MYIFIEKSIIAIAASALLLSCSPNQKNEKGKPNFIVILADDLGFSDLGCYGSEIATPNLDKLADEGLRMSHFYNSSRCCPSRAALLTGVYQHQAGVGHMVNNYPHPSYQGHLNEYCVTIAEVLKENGYNTYMSGKWHVGETEEFWPRQRGFDEYFGLINGASSYYAVHPYRYNQAPKTMVSGDSLFFPPDSGFYATDAYTGYACQFLDNQKTSESPFLLYLAYTAPHWPLHALPEDIEKYRGKYLQGWDSIRLDRYRRLLEKGIISPETQLSGRDPEVPEWSSLNENEKEEWDLRMAVYAAMIDRMDQGIGKVLDKLKEIGAFDNTLIVFLSDNGGSHECVKNCGRYIPRPGETGTPDSWDAYERPWANVSNTPFRLFKHWVHEGGISTPFIAWCPDLISKDQISNQPAHIIDIMATIVDLSGTEYPNEYKGKAIVPLQGKSLRKIFEGESWDESRILFWEHQGNRAVLSGNWKLVSKFPENKWELYNIKEDREEENNLASSYRELVDSLNRAYNNWAKKTGVVPRHELLKMSKQESSH